MMDRVLRALLWTAAVVAAGGYVYLAGLRLAEPAPIDSVEAGIMEQASRLANGEAAYTEPAPQTPPLPLPVLPVLLWPLVKILDFACWEPRALTLLATFGAAFLVMKIVAVETKSLTIGVASAGMMLAGCAIVTPHPAAASPEPFMILFALAGFHALRYGEGVRGALIAAFLFATACFAQQLGIWLAAGALATLAYDDRRRLITFLVAFVVLFGGGYELLSLQLGPWFNYHAWDAMVSTMQPDLFSLLHYVGTDLLGLLGVLAMMTVLSFALPGAPWRGPGGMWMCMGIAMFVGGALATQSPVSAASAVLPSVATLAVIGPISMKRVTHHLSAWPGSSRLGGQGVVLAALTLQFVALFANVSPTLFALPR